MRALIVVNNPRDWSFSIPGVEVVSARSYLTRTEYSDLRGVTVFNLCKSYRYQSLGYYVSLLAAARGHRPVPSVTTIQDLKANEIVRIRSDELDDLIQKSLAPIQSSSFVLSIYFGKNLAKRYDRVSAHLFKLFYAPLLRATFNRSRGGHWFLSSILPISSGEIPETHRDFVEAQARHYFHQRRWVAPKVNVSRYDLAILFDPEEEEPPSDERAIAKFVKAAQRLGMSATVIGKDDYANLAEFDALFIRETTNVNHYTYRFARRAHAEGMVVIDDPDSILRCTNKVFLAELLERHKVPAPRTVVLHRDNIGQVAETLGLPCILKRPDSAFSQGVIKVSSEDELRQEAERMFTKSELVIAQEFFPTDFDWRIGVLAGEPLWAAKYHMAPKHWQIIKGHGSGRRYGRVEAVAMDDVPRPVVRTALRAANLIGDGLYGVDLKQRGRRVTVVEVNDNPSLEAGYEDTVLKDALYDRVMQVFVDRISAHSRGL
ncbi:MAG: RimK family protein [Myxococcales bacterium]|nr:RimK family protein [Myxococcales bacterium]MCB9581907.1 RimK family protein [Polyangiaceae bacterium]